MHPSEYLFILVHIPLAQKSPLVSPGKKYSPSAPSVFLLNSFIRLQRALWSVVVQRWNALTFSENIRLNIHEAPVKGSPSSDHEVGNGQVDQVEVDRRSHRLVEDHLVVKRVDVRGFLSKMYFVPCWRERWKEFDWNKEVTKGWGESYFWRITPAHQHLLYFELKFEVKPQACTKHFTNNVFEIMKNYRKYDKDISDDGDQDEKNNCCLDMSIWTLSVTFFSMSHFGHLELHYGWFFTVWKLVYYLFYF